MISSNRTFPLIIFYSFLGFVFAVYLIANIPVAGGVFRFIVYGFLLLLALGLGIGSWAATKSELRQKQIDWLHDLFKKPTRMLGIVVCALVGALVFFGLAQINAEVFNIQLVRNACWVIGLFLVAVSFLGLATYLDSLNKNSQAVHRYWLRAIVVAGVPVLLTTFLVGLIFRTTIFAYMPWNSDEMMYWHQAKTYSAVGFGGGYYTSYERVAPASFTHFGPHGPIYPVVYGSFGAVFGWGYATAVILNNVFLLGAVLLFIHLTRPNQEDLKYFGLGLALYSPLTLFSGASMFETFQHVAAIILAGLLWQLVHQRLGMLGKAALIMVLIIASLARVNWLFFFPMVLYFLLNRLSLITRLLVSVIGGTLVGLTIFSVWQMIVAPYGEEIVVYGTRFDNYILYLQSAGEKLMEAAAWQWESLSNYQGALVVSLYVILGFTLYSLRRVWSGDTHFERVTYSIHPYVLSLALISTTLLSTTIASRGYRYLAPFLLFVCLWLFLQRRLDILRIVALLFLLYFPSFIGQYTSYLNLNYNFAYKNPSFIEFKRLVEEHLVYEPNSNAWCNSLLVEEDPQPFVSVPAGIGIAAKFEDEATDRYTLPLKSKYVLLDRHANFYIPDANFRALAETQYGTLYLNLDSDCFN